MITQISWASYFTAIVIIIVIYYLSICFIYYKDEIKQIILGNSKWAFNKQPSNQTGHPNRSFEQNPENEDSESFQQELTDEKSINEVPQGELFPLLNQLGQEIKMQFEVAARKGYVKEETVMAVQLVLKKYPGVKATPFEAVVKNYILNEFVNYCSIHLSEEELNRLWMK